jgi:hypothetical protein
MKKYKILLLYMTRTRKHKKGGGFWDSLTGLGNSISEGATNLWNKTKNAYSSETTPTSSYSGGNRSKKYGGKRRRRNHKR